MSFQQFGSLDSDKGLILIFAPLLIKIIPKIVVYNLNVDIQMVQFFFELHSNPVL